MMHDAPSGDGGKNSFLRWLVGGLLLFLLALAVSIRRGVNTADEAWFLQVVYRVTQGDVLYKDVFFGITPMSVYMMLPFTRLLGSEILFVKTAMASCYSVTILLANRIAIQLGHKTTGRRLLTFALMLYFLPNPDSLYKALAQVFLLQCFSLALYWQYRNDRPDNSGRDAKPLVAAGAFAGLCFLSDQLFGMCTLAALVLAIVVGSRLHAEGQRPGVQRDLFLAGTAFGAVSVLFLLPVWIGGGWPKFADYGFLNKVNYVRTAGISYPALVAQQISPFLRNPAASNFGPLFQYSLYLLPPFVLAGILLRWRTKKEDRGQTTFVLIFVTAAFLTAFPRADWFHFIYAIPLLMIGLMRGLSGLEPLAQKPLTRAARVGIWTWLLLGAVALAWGMFGNLGAGQFTVSQLPHFRGALFPSSEYRAIETYSGQLKRAGRNTALLIVVPDAGFYYLVSGLRNPSPFDYPLVTAFGRSGEADLVDRISRGEITRVCLRDLTGTWAESLQPKLLETYVQHNLVPEGDIGLCTLYHRP